MALEKVYKKSTVLLIGIIFIILFLVLLRFSHVSEIVRLIRNFRFDFIFLVLALQLIKYFFAAGILSEILGFYRIKEKIFWLYRKVFLVNFLNAIVPSLGLGGIYYLAQSFKEKNLSLGKGLSLGVIYFIVIWLGIFLVLPISLVYGIVMGFSIGQESLRWLILPLILFLLLIGLIIYLTKNQPLSRLLINRLCQLINRFFHLFIKRNLISIGKVDFLLNEYFLGIRNTKKIQKNIFELAFYALLYTFSDILSLYVIFVALGSTVPILIIAAGYALGNIISLILPLPSTVGTYELSVIIVYVWLGVGYETALLATFVFRAFSFWLLLPISFYLISRSERLKPSENEKK